METALLQIIGALLTSTGLGMLVATKTYNELVEDFANSPALVVVAGMMSLILGLIVVMNHNVWTDLSASLVSLFGWISTIKGVLLLVFPNTAKCMSKCKGNMMAWIRVEGLVLLVVGAYMAYQGWMM